MFRARLMDAGFQPGKESLKVGLFTEAEVPWEQIAFRVISETLRAYFRDRSTGAFPFAVADILPAPDQARRMR
jgi:hypothetical protein